MLLTSTNWSVSRLRYEIYVIKISASPEKGKMDFSNFSKELKVFPNLFLCVYILNKFENATFVLF